MAMSDKRSQKREHLIFYLKVLDRDSRDVIGRLGDLSTKGLLLLSKQAHTPGETHRLSIDLSDLDVLLTKKSIDFDAEVKWSHQDINPSHYISGFQFLSISDKDIGVINKIVESVGFSH
ncbi:MAG: PilZ domain-containing protein [Fibrobacterota bacterium]|jgi:c-di-GMP-binding flagellar brake protein YcgR